MPADTDVLIGFIVRPECPIGCDEWIEFAAKHPKLKAIPPRQGINPFTRQPMLFESPHSFVVDDGERRRGSMGWEESECVFVNGRDPIVMQVVQEACLLLHAEFEPFDESAK